MSFKDWLQTRRGNNFGHFAIGLILCSVVAVVVVLLPPVSVIGALWIGWLAQSFGWLFREASHVEARTKEDYYGRWWVPYLRVLFGLKTNPDEFWDFWAPVLGVGAVVVVIVSFM